MGRVGAQGGQEPAGIKSFSAGLHSRIWVTEDPGGQGSTDVMAGHIMVYGV